MQSAACRFCPQKADKTHTCSLSGVFSHAHVAAENRLAPFSRLRARTLRGFFDTQKPPGMAGGLLGVGQLDSSRMAASSQSPLFSERPGGHSSSRSLAPPLPKRPAVLGSLWGPVMAFSWAAGGASVPAEQVPPGALRAGFHLLGANELPRHQGFGPVAQNACTAQSAAPSLTGPPRTRRCRHKKAVPAIGRDSLHICQLDSSCIALAASMAFSWAAGGASS